jgi:Gas vesicle synthesis protein GvpL/GvpF
MTSGSPSIVTQHARGAEAARGRYLYCIIETDEGLALGPLGIGEEENPVYTVHHGGMAAVVSETSLRRYEPTRENLLAHERVNETVMRDHTVIPMAFGTILPGDSDVVALLGGIASALTEALGAVRGRVELGLNVVWDRDRVLSELEGDHEAIRRLRGEIANEGGGSTYFSRVQLGRLVEEALEARARDLLWGVYESLRPLSVASRGGKLVGDNMILNVAFLVERAREDEFNQAVEGLTARYDGLLSFKYTGPWPPYSFVRLRLEVEETD